MSKLKSVSGFSLIEVMVALSLVVTMAVLAVPAISAMVNSSRLNSAAGAMFNSLYLTRSEAVKRNARVVMCKSADGQVCTDMGDWQQGWIIFHDANNNSEMDAGEELIYREAALPTQLSFSGNGPVKDYVSYTAIGKSKLMSGAFQAGTFTACLRSATATDARLVVINSSGRPRMDKSKLTQCV